MAEDPNLLRKEILSEFDPAIIGGGSFQRRIAACEADFPITLGVSDRYSQNRHMFVHIVQELNRKLNKFGFADQIVHPIDAGFRPLDSFYDNPGCFFRPRIIPRFGHGWGVKSLISTYKFDGAAAPVDPKVMQVQRPGANISTNRKDFKASEVEDGTLLAWVTENDPNADGGVRILYDQGPQDPVRSSSAVYTDTYDFHQYYNVQQPKIVINGALSRDSEGKVALNGNGAKMQLGGNNQNTVQDFFSSDGSWSLFFVTDFQDYSTATNANVQIIHLTTSTNGGANSPRKPIIACNRANNELAIAQSTQTAGSDVLGNIFLPTYPGEQLLSSFGNPASSTNNNEAFLDGVGRGAVGHATTNAATAVNTSTNGNQTENVIFQPSEVGVTTFLSALVYSPTYEFFEKDRIEKNLIEEFDITFD